MVESRKEYTSFWYFLSLLDCNRPLAVALNKVSCLDYLGFYLLYFFFLIQDLTLVMTIKAKITPGRHGRLYSRPLQGERDLSSIPLKQGQRCFQGCGERGKVLYDLPRGHVLYIAVILEFANVFFCILLDNYISKRWLPGP